MTNIAIFASGEGTNAENIIRHFQGNDSVRVAVVIYNRKAAGVRQRAERLGVPAVYWTKQQLEDRAATLQLLGQYGCQFIVLAGFLLLVPAYLVEAFPERIWWTSSSTTDASSGRPPARCCPPTRPTTWPTRCTAWNTPVSPKPLNNI